MKFALALLAFSAVQAVEVETAAEIEWSGYGHHGHSAYRTASTYVSRPYVKVHAYNGHGHHSSSYSSSSDDSYSSDDYSSSDYGYGYRHHHGRNRHYRYRPVYNSGRYYYGNRYASHTGHYKAAYRSYSTHSYNRCNGCVRPATYGYVAKKW